MSLTYSCRPLCPKSGELPARPAIGRTIADFPAERREDISRAAVGHAEPIPGPRLAMRGPVHAYTTKFDRAGQTVKRRLHGPGCHVQIGPGAAVKSQFDQADLSDEIE